MLGKFATFQLSLYTAKATVNYHYTWQSLMRNMQRHVYYVHQSTRAFDVR
jgi:hypothetical protein